MKQLGKEEDNSHPSWLASIPVHGFNRIQLKIFNIVLHYIYTSVNFKVWEILDRTHVMLLEKNVTNDRVVHVAHCIAHQRLQRLVIASIDANALDVAWLWTTLCQRSKGNLSHFKNKT